MTVLVTAGGGFALLFILNALIRTARRSEKIGFTETLLAFLALLVTLAALVVHNLAPTRWSLIEQAALGIAVGLIVPSLLILLIEAFRPQRLKQSRGVLGMGIGLLLALSTLIVPLVSGYISRTAAVAVVVPTPINDVGSPTPDVSAGTAALTTTPLPPTRTATLTPTPTATRTPRPTETPTATRPVFVYLSRTPTLTPTVPNPCLAVMNYNVNLRAEPKPDAQVIVTIPYQTAVPIFGRNDDSTWWFANYNGQAGWVKGEFIQLSAGCSDLPVRK